jgi:predicted hydrocarbon binding protein
MSEGGIGRLLVASLHQGIADLLPTRLEFYEAWLNPAGLRDGRIGLAPFAAALSFLRLEGEPYHLIAGRAGEYTAEWTVADLSPSKRAMVRAAPLGLRTWIVMRLARRMIRQTYSGSRAIVRWKSGQGQIDIRGSIFCEVRERVANPLCEFYASAVRRLLFLFNLEADVGIRHCRATGAEQCLMSIIVRPVRSGVPA